MGVLAEVGSSVLLYFLVFGMSATVDIRQLRKQLRNRNALLTGITLQFIVLPFLGFVVVKLLQLPAPMGITLLVITSSPGGSYSNWYVLSVGAWSTLLIEAGGLERCVRGGSSRGKRDPFHHFIKWLSSF